MVYGYPFDYGDNLTVEQAYNNLSEHGKKVAYAALILLMTPTIAAAKEAVPIDTNNTSINNTLGFVAGMICVGLVTSFTGPAAMFAAGAFCAGTFTWLIKR